MAIKAKAWGEDIIHLDYNTMWEGGPFRSVRYEALISYKKSRSLVSYNACNVVQSIIL